MATITKKMYEAMFLVDSGEAGSNWDAVLGTINNIFERADAEVVSVKKWDERRLAYDIGSASRGTYILCYFRGDGDRIREIERNVQLSERLMRVLILRADHVTEEDIEKDTPATVLEKSDVADSDTQVEQAGAEDVSKAAAAPEAEEGAAEPEEVVAVAAEAQGHGESVDAAEAAPVTEGAEPPDAEEPPQPVAEEPSTEVEGEQDKSSDENDKT